VKVILPFSPDHLIDVPDDFDIEVADATEAWPRGAAEAQFYVPSYQFSRRVIDVISAMGRLEVVQTLTAGVEHIAPVIPAGVTLCNAAGVHDAATSELAVGLMIAAQRRFKELVRAQDAQRWDQQMSSSLADRSVLVLGAGNIGRALQRRLDGFECAVTLVGRSARDGVHGVDELPSLLPRADIVVLIVPLTSATRGVVDRSFLARMPDDALLVNVARGPVVDTTALLAELQARRLRAALDVTDPEPLPAGHPLWDAPGVLLTPHVGGASTSMWPRSYALVSEQLRRVAAGRPLLNVV
jgi:phosphoglycerate dehydrogenase-like enzyme